MRVLHVVDRVVLGMALGQFQVEIQVLVVAAHHVEETRRIGADFLAQFAQGDEAAGTRRHLHTHAATEQDGELHQLDLDAAGVEPQPLRRRLQTGDVTMVIGTEDVQGALETAFELRQQIAEVGGEIGGDAVLAHDHAILVVAEIGGAEPGGAAVVVQMAAFAQSGDGALHVAVGHQRPFGEEIVVHDAEAGEVAADVGQAPAQAGVEDDAVVGVAEQLLGAGDQRIDVQFLVAALRFVGRQAVGDFQCAMAQAVAFLGAQAAGDVDHVLALVAIVREAHVDAAELVIAQPHRHRQDVHLPAGVVDVVLALYLVAGRFQQVGDGGAVGGAAAMADVQRAVRIGGNEFDGDRFARLADMAAVLAAEFEHATNRGQPARLRDGEIDEAGAGDLDLGHVLRLAEGGDQGFGQLARLHAGRFGQQQGDIGCIVAVIAGFRPFDHVVRGGQILGQAAVPAQVEQGLGHQFAQMFFHGS